MKYVIGATAVLAAIGTAAYFYLQDKDADAYDERKANNQAEATAEAEEPAANI